MERFNHINIIHENVLVLTAQKMTKKNCISTAKQDLNGKMKELKDQNKN
jgi:hypothetical protein